MAENNRDNNPRNRQSTLFKRLTRLFSGPMVDYDRPAVIRGNRRDVKKYTFTSSTGKEFKKKEEEYKEKLTANQIIIILRKKPNLRTEEEKTLLYGYSLQYHIL